MLIQLLLCLLPLTTAYVVSPSLSKNGTSKDEHDVESRIRYGKPAKIVDHPYYAHLDHCGACIVSESWVLTAAHCVAHIRNGYLWVGGETIKSGQKLYFKNVIIHPKYNSLLAIHDIALLKLSQPLRFNKRVQAIKLPFDKNIISNSNTYVFVGRGEDETGAQPDDIKEALMRIPHPSSVCHKMFLLSLARLLYFSPSELDRAELCVARVDDDYCACPGDSGSPLVYGDTLVGLVSWGYASSCSPDVAYFVNVINYVDWITRVMRTN